MDIKERLAKTEEKQRSLVAQIQGIQAQQQELEQRRQQLIAEMLRIEGERRLLQEMDGAGPEV